MDEVRIVADLTDVSLTLAGKPEWVPVVDAAAGLYEAMGRGRTPQSVMALNARIFAQHVRLSPPQPRQV